MAREIEEIYNEAITEKETVSSLDGLTSDNFQQLISKLSTNSKVAIWSLVFYIGAVMIWMFENLQDLFKRDVEYIMNTREYAQDGWYVYKALGYQEGYNTVLVNGIPQYDTEDENAKVVKYASATPNINRVTVKIAGDNAGNPVALSAAQAVAVKDYLTEIAPMGVPIDVITGGGDLLQQETELYYDAKIGLAVVQPRVEEAINTYLANLDFNGIFKVNAYIDALQAVEGVVDIKINSIAADNGSTIRAIERIYISRYGYMKVDPGYPLSDSNVIQYINADV